MIKSVQLYGDGIGKVDYIQHMGSDKTVVNAARVSFDQEVEDLEEKDAKLIKYLIKHKHTSTLEHNMVTFRVTCPLFVRSQFHRHRTWSYNEVSRRYTEENMQFHIPSTLRSQAENNRQSSDPVPMNDEGYWQKNMVDHTSESLGLYTRMIAQGCCREQARAVLPQNLYTKFWATANLNNILKFVSLRTHDGAQEEIKEVAMGILDITTDLFPVTVGAYRELTGL